MIAIVLPYRANWTLLRGEMLEEGQQVTGKTVVLTGQMHGQSVALVRADPGELPSASKALESLGVDTLLLLTYCRQLDEGTPHWLGIVRTVQTSKGALVPCDQEVVAALDEKARSIIGQIHWSAGFSPTPVAGVLLHQQQKETTVHDSSLSAYQEIDSHLGDLVPAIQEARVGVLALPRPEELGRQRLTLALCCAIVTAFVTDWGVARPRGAASDCAYVDA